MAFRHQLKCLHTLRRKYKRSPTTNNCERLRIAEEKFQKDVKDSKSNYETELISSYASRNNFKIFLYIWSLSNPSPYPALFIMKRQQPVMTKIEQYSLINIFTLSSIRLILDYLNQVVSLPIHIPFHELKYLRQRYTKLSYGWIQIKLLA